MSSSVPETKVIAVLDSRDPPNGLALSFAVALPAYPQKGILETRIQVRGPAAEEAALKFFYVSFATVLIVWAASLPVQDCVACTCPSYVAQSQVSMDHTS